jgi:hypothetical protein
MTDLILLSDAEISAVAGGVISQSIDLDATQRNTSIVTQRATAINSARVTATATGTGALAAAAGAEAINTAVVTQANLIVVRNNL